MVDNTDPLYDRRIESQQTSSYGGLIVKICLMVKDIPFSEKERLILIRCPLGPYIYNVRLIQGERYLSKYQYANIFMIMASVQWYIPCDPLEW